MSALRIALCIIFSYTHSSLPSHLASCKEHSDVNAANGLGVVGYSPESFLPSLPRCMDAEA